MHQAFLVFPYYQMTLHLECSTTTTYQGARLPHPRPGGLPDHRRLPVRLCGVIWTPQLRPRPLPRAPPPPGTPQEGRPHPEAGGERPCLILHLLENWESRIKELICGVVNPQPGH